MPVYLSYVSSIQRTASSECCSSSSFSPPLSPHSPFERSERSPIWDMGRPGTQVHPYNRRTWEDFWVWGQPLHIKFQVSQGYTGLYCLTQCHKPSKKQVQTKDTLRRDIFFLNRSRFLLEIHENSILLTISVIERKRVTFFSRISNHSHIKGKKHNYQIHFQGPRTIGKLIIYLVKNRNHNTKI